MQNSSLTHPTGHFWVKFIRKNLDISYQHIYLGHPLKLKGVWAYIILGDFTGATPIGCILMSVLIYSVFYVVDVKEKV
jgi:hypothetical protein